MNTATAMVSRARGAQWAQRVLRRPSWKTAAIYTPVLFVFFLMIAPFVTEAVADKELAEMITGWGSEEIDRGTSLVAPFTQGHILGTDAVSQDILARIIQAPKINLLIAVVAATLSVLMGVPLGGIAGFLEGRGKFGAAMSELIMRAMDVLQSFPVFIFAIVLVAVTSPSAKNVIIALTIVNLPVFVRLARSDMLTAREQPYADAAKILGHSNTRLIFRHLLPNSVASSLAQVPVVVGFVILFTASLSFVGAGVPPPTAELGGMISRGSKNLYTGQWWPSIFPGIALGLTVFFLALAAQDIGTRMRVVKRGDVAYVEAGVQSGT